MTVLPQAAGTGQLRWELAGRPAADWSSHCGGLDAGGGQTVGGDGGGLSLVAPEGDAKADQGDAGRDRERPLKRVRQHGNRKRGEGTEDEEPGSPAGQDACAE